jgi:phage shock protein E
MQRIMFITVTVAGVAFAGCPRSDQGSKRPAVKAQGSPKALTVANLLKDPKRLVIDVRTKPEFEQGHVPGSVNLPLHKIREIHGVVGADKSRAVVLYCRSGARSGRAKQLMRKWGYTRVINAGTVSQMASAMGVEIVTGSK